MKERREEERERGEVGKEGGRGTGGEENFGPRGTVFPFLMVVPCLFLLFDP